MGKILIGLIIGLLLGVAGGIFLLGPAMIGIGAGTGVIMSMKTSACVLQEARDDGIVTAEQVELIMSLAARELGATAGEEMTGPSDCDEFMAGLREASAE